jgi:hypothetical protein
VNKVGNVLVWNDETTLFVQYVIDTANWPLWGITQTHVHVATSMEGIPQENGNPPPGQFEYKFTHNYEVGPITIPIDLEWDPCTELYIAAHADVGVPGGVEGLELFLPDLVTVKVQYPYPNAPSYFPGTMVSGGTSLDGTYDAWCVDTDHTIGQNTGYTAEVYSTYEDLPDGLVDHPENLDLVNWILNQNYVGKSSPGGHGTYTYGDVQRAIWVLLEDTLSTNGLGSWSQARVDEILAAAYANGGGYEPGCGGVMGIILAPTPFCTAQFILIVVDVPCEEEETAWAGVPGEDIPGPDDGDNYRYEFPGKNWAMYFKYKVQCPPPVLINGDFETPDTAGWGVYPSGTPGLGWTVEWLDKPDTFGGPPVLELQDSGVAISNPGGQLAELDTDLGYWPTPPPEKANVAIYQDINTCPCAQYEITYRWTPRPGSEGSCAMEVLWDGTKIADHSAGTWGWLTETHIVNGGSGATTRLEFREVGTADSHGTLLDDVTVELLPPSP